MHGELSSRQVVSTQWVVDQGPGVDSDRLTRCDWGGCEESGPGGLGVVPDVDVLGSRVDPRCAQVPGPGVVAPTHPPPALGGEAANDQLKTHLRGPGKILRSRLPDLVHQELGAHLIVHHAMSALTAKVSAADLDPDQISFTKALRLIRRTTTGTADIPPSRLG